MGDKSRARRLDDELISFVRRPTNLGRAWQAVQANSRTSTSPYVKDETNGFAGDEQRRLRSIASRIQHETYKFSKGRGVAIEKKGKPGRVRPIVISRVEDRIVQRCVLNALNENEQIRARAFQPFSFGGIPKKGNADTGGVRAAVGALLDAIQDGATHVMVADIEGFFTKISKSACVSLIERHTSDRRFIKLLESAISVDLENSRSLWKYKDQFPYGDIGIGQGNCLSPFLGNLILSDFDVELNEGDCRCLRYIDDIIIAAPSGRAASSRMRQAGRHLAQLGMNFAEGKSSPAPIQVSQNFEYLGIEFDRGMIRPSKKSRISIVSRASEVAAESIVRMKKCDSIEDFDQNFNIQRTLNRISGMAKGWAHHYIFCNDVQTVRDVDNKICDMYLRYLEKSQSIALKKSAKITAAILGYRGTAGMAFEPVTWPKHDIVP